MQMPYSYKIFSPYSSVRVALFIRLILQMPQKSQSLEEDFAAAYDLYADAIFRHCYFRVHEREKAVDLMQETFMKTWEYLASGKKVENLRAFLYRTANNLIIDQARRAKLRKEESLEDMQEEGFDVSGEDGRDIGTALDGRHVVATMKKIEEPYRSALILRYVDELSPKEISEVIGEPVNTVSVRINRGVKKLRSLLPQYG